MFQNDLTITNLELEDNALGAEGARHMMEMLQTNMSIESLVTILKTTNTSVLKRVPGPRPPWTARGTIIFYWTGSVFA